MRQRLIVLAVGLGMAKGGSAPGWAAESLPAAPVGPHKDVVAVMPLAGTGIEPAVLRALDGAFVYAVADLGPYKAISPAEIDAQLGRERMKEAAGCPLDSVSCAAEIVGALGAPLLLQGQVARLGGKCRVTLALIDTRSQEVLKRGQGSSPDDPRAYESAVDAAVRDLFGLAPRQKSEVDFGGAVLLPPPVSVPEGDLGVVAIEVEKLLDHALVTQDDPRATPTAKADAWCALASTKVKPNAYAKQANAACKSWRGYAKSFEERQAALSKSYAMVRDYVGLKRKTKAQKVAVIEEFLRQFGGVEGLEREEVKAARERMLDSPDGQLGPLPAGSCTEVCVESGRCTVGDFGCVRRPGVEGLNTWRTAVWEWRQAATQRQSELRVSERSFAKPVKVAGCEAATDHDNTYFAYDNGGFYVSYSDSTDQRPLNCRTNVTASAHAKVAAADIASFTLRCDGIATFPPDAAAPLRADRSGTRMTLELVAKPGKSIAIEHRDFVGEEGKGKKGGRATEKVWSESVPVLRRETLWRNEGMGPEGPALCDQLNGLMQRYWVLHRGTAALAQAEGH